MSECKIKSAWVWKFDLGGIARVYSHDSLSRFWFTHNGDKVNETK